MNIYKSIIVFCGMTAATAMSLTTNAETTVN